MLFAPLCAFLSVVGAAVSLSSPTTPAPYFAHGAATTSLSGPRFDEELRKRLVIDNSKAVCGTTRYRTHYCVTGSNVCAATIVSDGHAYQYCSNNDFANHYHTTALPSWNPNEPCPSLATCWYAIAAHISTEQFLTCSSTDTVSPDVKKLLFIASKYTVTGYGCAVLQTTIKFDAFTNLLDPPSFSASLAQLARSTRMSVSTSTSIQSINTKSTSTTSLPKKSPSASAHSTNSGLSSSTQIGIGAGLGVGVGVLLIFGLVFFCWQRRRKREQPHKQAYAVSNDSRSHELDNNEIYEAREECRKVEADPNARRFELDGGRHGHEI